MPPDGILGAFVFMWPHAGASSACTVCESPTIHFKYSMNTAQIC